MTADAATTAPHAATPATSLRSSSDEAVPSTLATVGWAVYLGSSWTWCIGMFLPVLLVRDYGLWGWIVFAVPNVLGAAAMGWVMTRVRDVDAFERNHSAALTMFSVVTVAFHLFFMNWIIARLLPVGGVMAMLTIVPIFVAGQWLARRGRGGGVAAGTAAAGDVPAAALVMAISLVAWVVYLRYGYWPPLAPRDPLRSLSDLYWLAPVCVLGFALNPYLDRTFHHAYHAARPARAPLAFALGFGGFFFLMILFTLTYARRLAPAVADPAFVMIGVVLWALGFHMTFQSAFTVAVHLRSTPHVLLSLIAAAVLAVVVYGLGLLTGDALDLSSGEASYRLFMAFYGLVFPAYGWICMWRITDGRAVSGRAWLVFTIAVLVAAPCFWLGFMNQRMVWLVPGLAIVLLARLALRGSRPGQDGA